MEYWMFNSNGTHLNHYFKFSSAQGLCYSNELKRKRHTEVH